LLNPVIVNPLAVLGSVAVPPGMVAEYDADVATLLGTTVSTVMSWFCAITLVAVVAKHCTCDHDTGVPLVFAAPETAAVITKAAEASTTTPMMQAARRQAPELERRSNEVRTRALMNDPPERPTTAK
jgi:hypothetical protein